MSFTGKSTYTAGASLPELAEDISDIVGIVSPYETPLLNALGDPLRSAASVFHQWVEDELLPNKDVIEDDTFANPVTDTQFNVKTPSRFRLGDQIQIEGSRELMLVTAISGVMLTVVRGYAGTTPAALVTGTQLNILGNAAIEGADRPTARFTSRLRKGNYTQIFTASVEVSGSDIAARQVAVADEMDYQKQERLRELLRDLECTVLNGGQAAANPQGSDSVRRTMRGIIPHLTSNVFAPGAVGFPSGADLDETKLNYVLRKIWEASSGTIDLIVVNGYQKRRINSFLTGQRSFGPDDTAYRDMVDVYQSDFGVCRVVTSRWMPQDAVLMLDSSRVSVLPLAGRSFHFKPLASSGDYECGELIGEYTLELKNEAAHGLIRGLNKA